jgi:hypothetical protein
MSADNVRLPRRTPLTASCDLTMTTSDKDVSVGGVSDWNSNHTMAPCNARLSAVALLLLLSSCTNVGPPASPQWSQVAFSNFTSIAGRWEGTMHRNLQSHRIVGDDWVQVAIRQDGKYAFESYRPIGVFKGKGQLTIADGKATARTDEGRVTFMLFEADGTRMLRAHGASNDGIEYVRSAAGEIACRPSGLRNGWWLV